MPSRLREAQSSLAFNTVPRGGCSELLLQPVSELQAAGRLGQVTDVWTLRGPFACSLAALGPRASASASVPTGPPSQGCGWDQEAGGLPPRAVRLLEKTRIAIVAHGHL